MSNRLRLGLTIFILGTCVGCDQISKGVARQALRGAPPWSFLGDTLRFELAHNPGGFLSLGASIPDGMRQTLFVATNGALMALLAAFLVWNRRLPRRLFVGLLCILAGGIGNLIDRLWNDGLVTDFINIGIGPLRTGIFNFADVAVMCGALAVCVGLYLAEEQS